ncbi:hypothetical protein Tco_1443833 [Tanacetum coccineum]
MPLKRKLTELRDVGGSHSSKRLNTSDQGFRSPVSLTPNTNRKGSLPGDALQEKGEQPSQKNHRCGYFKWKDEITFGNASSFSGPTTPLNFYSRASSSSGSSRAALSPGNTEYSNCKLLTMKIKILEARLAMEKNPDDHPCKSATILHELLNEMENLHVE